MQTSVQNIYDTQVEQEQTDDKAFYNSPETLENSLKFSGLKQSWHGYGINNQELQMFEYLRQLWLSEDKLHNNGFQNDIEPSMSQKFISNPKAKQPLHGYQIYEIADAFASNKKRMQENLTKFIQEQQYNHKNTELDQRRMPNRMQIPMSGCEYDPLKWQKYMTLRYLSSEF